MTIGMVRGLLTLVLLIAFIALWAWAWSKRRQDDFEAAALLPLQDDAQPPQRS
ncbi:MAG TPA: cbb3-type cytochrome c oxidase subunit 3 [Steroidobacter sp.]|jgi:cytochrome c oxidase cbb3-type subunit 4|nr:cbb3-type cytochrome c oxidase subunit 3 [Steroidobacteraceae bacterium]HLS81350.1 cbb3-type cytochrome c oxidase subunit 3 [Steroidobacter sp.]